MTIPLNTTGEEHRRAVHLFSVLCLLIFALSIAGIITSSLALNIRSAFPPYRNFGGRTFDVLQEGARGPSVDTFDPLATTGWMYQLLPRDIRYGNEKAVLGVSIIVLILILVPLVTSVFRDVRLHPRHRTKGFPGFNIVLTGGCFLAAFIGVVYTQAAIPSDLVRVDVSSPPYPGTSDPGRTIGSSGTYTYSVEGWSCGIRKVMTRFGANDNHDFEVMSESCHTSRAAKWITVALLVLCAAVLGLSFVVVSQGDRTGVKTDQAVKGETALYAEGKMMTKKLEGDGAT